MIFTEAEFDEKLFLLPKRQALGSSINRTEENAKFSDSGHTLSRIEIGKHAKLYHVILQF